MGLEVDRADVEELVEDHRRELTIDELRDLHKEQTEISSADEEEVCKGQISKAELRRMFSFWSKLQGLVEKWHPDIAMVTENVTTFNENVIAYFRKIMKVETDNFGQHNDDARQTTPSHGRKSQPPKKEKVPLLTVPQFSLPLDLRDGQGWSGNQQRLPRAASSDTFTFTREHSRAPPLVPWDQEPLNIPFQDIEDLLDKEIVQAVKDDDVSALEECVELQGKLSEKVLLLACRYGSNTIAVHLIQAGVNLHCKDTQSGFDAISTAVYFDNGCVVASLAEDEILNCLPKIDFNGVTITLLHLAAFYGCHSSIQALCGSVRLNVNVDEPDSLLWKPIHYAIARGQTAIVNELLRQNANPDSEGPFKVRPLHVAAYKEMPDIVELLLDNGADPRKIVSLNPPRYSFSFELMELEVRKTRPLPPVVTYNAKCFSTMLHWAVARGTPSLVEKMLSAGSSIDVLDLQGRTPLGLALVDGHTDILRCFSERGISLSDEDKNWRRIMDEENGLKVLNILETTNLDTLNCSSKEGFSLLHLAASKGYLSLLNRLLIKGVSPNLETVRGETPLFFAIENNHQACVQQLIRSGCNICHISKRNSSVLHSAAKFNNFAAIDMILNMVAGKKILDINLADEHGFTAIYYAISAGRYDIVQRFVQFCVSESIHVKATRDETLLQFYTERNILGQYDNAIVRVLELEKELHSSKFNSEKCLRMQLGTTEASTKAREQLQALYESTHLQRHCWNFWVVISCFLMPSILYFLDVYTDVLLAFEYYNDYIEITTNETGSPPDKKGLQIIFENITESQSKINLMLTVFFILFPMSLLSVWSLYVHITQEDILPPIKRMASIQRILLYLLLYVPPIGPIVTYIENSYAQVKYMNVTAELLEQPISSPSVINLVEEDKTKRESTASARLREHYNLKNVAQMRVAISNVLEATLESAFQLILQLFILGTQYKDLKELHLGDLTLGSILSLTPTEDSQSRLSKQALSVLISLVSLTWSFTAYHRFSKLGGLRILWALPLLFAIFFQIISRAIACTVFTLAHTWKIFIVLGVHYLVMLLLKTAFERRTHVPNVALFRINRFLASIRPYFYVILGAFTSTFVYFRIQRPLADKDQLSQRHSSFLIQILFLLLSLIENTLLFGLGVAHLDPSDYDEVFKIVSGILCLISFIIGIILQWVYYGCFGHPWVNINGPTVEREAANGTLLVSFYKEGGQIQWAFRSCGDCSRHFEEQKDNVYIPKTVYLKKELSNGSNQQYPNGRV